jgi:flavodoxin
MSFINAKSLVAYFSRDGNNYVSGSIINLPMGNTEVITKMIQEKIGSDIFRIETVNSYPADYSETTKVAQKELKENARPKLTARVNNMESYDVIFLGYPNWWGTMPMAVYTFLEEYDFIGKTIIPFCTHEGSGLGHSEKDIAKLCPKAKVLNGKAFLGSGVKSAQKEVTAWLSQVGAIS